MKNARSGFVLVSVLWVIALLAIITISYHHRARLEVRAARYSLDSSQARLAAKAAVARAMVALRNKAVLDGLPPTSGQAPLPPATFLGQAWAQPHDLNREEGLLNPGPGFENDEVTYAIEDLDRYININKASEEVIAALPGMSLPVARRINYRRAGEGDVPSQPFQEISELRYIRGVDDEAWYGDGDEPGLRDVLTTHGDGRVNINTAPLEVLQHLPDVDPTAAEDLVAIRNGADGLSGTEDDVAFRDWLQFSELTRISGDSLIALQQLCKFNSNCFKISAVATRRGGMIRVQSSAIVLVPEGSDVASLIAWSEDSLGSP